MSPPYPQDLLTSEPSASEVSFLIPLEVDTQTCPYESASPDYYQISVVVRIIPPPTGPHPMSCEYGTFPDKREPWLR